MTLFHAISGVCKGVQGYFLRECAWEAPPEGVPWDTHVMDGRAVFRGIEPGPSPSNPEAKLIRQLVLQISGCSVRHPYIAATDPWQWFCVIQDSQNLVSMPH